MSKETGGPAFPVDCNWHDGVPTSGAQTSSKTGMATGITMRDYFAAHASDRDIDAVLGEHGRGNLTRPQARYVYADAMLRAREEA